jgi:hypothetical protein
MPVQANAAPCGDAKRQSEHFRGEDGGDRSPRSVGRHCYRGHREIERGGGGHPELQVAPDGGIAESALLIVIFSAALGGAPVI